MNHDLFVHQSFDLPFQANEKQIQRIRSIFHRQLSVPLADIQSTLQVYKAWEAEQGTSIDAGSLDLDGLSPLVALGYQKALQMYNARVPFEEKIAGTDVSDPERLQNFLVLAIDIHICYSVLINQS